MICQAMTKAGTPCTRQANHQHVTQIGTRVSVCGTHLRVLHKLERLGSDEERLTEWGVTAPGLTSPGSTSPPIPVDG